VNARDYAALYGPSAGDRVVLGDTGLVVEVEHDSQLVGDEFWPDSARPRVTAST
jgi:urease subunit alpha